jgi:hypothetical protein
VIKAASRTALGEPLLFAADELDEYLAEALRDPLFAAAYAAASKRARMMLSLPLAIDGHDYRSRHLARRRRRHR